MTDIAQVRFAPATRPNTQGQPLAFQSGGASAAVSDPVLAAIHRQNTACCLHALRGTMQGQGKWSDDLHAAAFEVQRQELEGRWK